MKARVLYLPIETKARELIGKILLASRAVERGWQVVLGPQEVVREALRHGPRGVFIEISIPEAKAERLAIIRSLGHRIANICEESIVYYDAMDYCVRKVGPSSVEQVDLLLVAGASNERDLRQYRPQGADKIVRTGNPRFDTLIPEARGVYETVAAPLRERFGRFLLVNTNFMRTNHVKFSADELISRLKSHKGVENQAHADMIKRQYDYKGAQMDKLQPILATIAASGSFDKIVVRPHPSENHNTWREWARPHGIEVYYEGSANSWMLASAAILHTGCTTGIEGVLLDRPVASYVPIPGHDLLNQSDAVSAPVGSAEDFLELSAKWQKVDASGRRDMLAEQRSKLVPLIANVEPPMSVDRILDALDKLDVAEGPVEPLRKPHVNPLVAMFRLFRAQRTSRLGAYHRQKFPSLTDEEIIEPVTTWIKAGVLTRAPEISRSPEGAWVLS